MPFSFPLSLRRTENSCKPSKTTTSIYSKKDTKNQMMSNKMMIIIKRKQAINNITPKYQGKRIQRNKERRKNKTCSTTTRFLSWEKSISFFILLLRVLDFVSFVCKKKSEKGKQNLSRHNGNGTVVVAASVKWRISIAYNK